MHFCVYNCSETLRYSLYLNDHRLIFLLVPIFSIKYVSQTSHGQASTCTLISLLRYLVCSRLSKDGATAPPSNIPADNTGTATTTTPSNKGSARKSRIPPPNLSESDSSDHEGTPLPVTAHKTNSKPYSSPVVPYTGADRLETSDRMSKEKRKFFRSSAFNADKKRDKKMMENEKQPVSDTKRPKDVRKDLVVGVKNEITPRVSQSRQCKVTKNKDELKKTQREGKTNDITEGLVRCDKQSESNSTSVVKKSHENVKVDEPGSSSSHESSSTSSDNTSDEDDSGSSESDSDSSMQQSENSRMSGNVKPLGTLKFDGGKTFGSVGGINSTTDKELWGFAAAAAEASKTSMTFASLIDFRKDERESTGKEKAKNGSDKSKPGFVQLKGLFDGLSHFFAPPRINRSRNVPNYNLSRRKKDEKGDALMKTQSVVENGVKVALKDDDLSKIQTRTRTRDRLKTVLPKPTEERRSSRRCIEANTETIKSRDAGSTVTHPPNAFPPVLPSEDIPVRSSHMTPSNLVKTAVNSKRHEFERRRFLKCDAGLNAMVAGSGFDRSATILEDCRVRKRTLIAEATQANSHHLSMMTLPQLADNQTGKIGLRPTSNSFSDTLPHPVLCTRTETKIYVHVDRGN